MANPLKMVGQLMKMKKEMNKLEVAGFSRDQKVKVKLNGMMKITTVEIDDSLLNPDMKRVLEERIKDAHKDAQKKIEHQMRSSMSMSDMKGMSGLMDRFK